MVDNEWVENIEHFICIRTCWMRGNGKEVRIEAWKGRSYAFYISDIVFYPPASISCTCPPQARRGRVSRLHSWLYNTLVIMFILLGRCWGSLYV